jgi:hypothetical protein
MSPQLDYKNYSYELITEKHKSKERTKTLYYSILYHMFIT